MSSGVPTTPSRSPWPLASLDALLLVAVLLFIFSPPWHVYDSYVRLPEYPPTVETRRGEALMELVRAPFAPVSDPYHRILETRWLLPLVAHALHLPSPVVFAGPFLFAVVAVAQMLVIARSRGVGRLASLGCALPLTACGWFISSTGWLGYYDSALLVGLLVVSHGGPRWGLVLACVLTPWIDERFVLALPLAFATRWLGGVGDFFFPAPASRHRFRQEAIIVAGLAATYLILRFTVAEPAQAHGLKAYLAEQETLKIGIGRHLLGLWESLRLGWCGVIAGLFFIRPLSASWRWVLWTGMLLTALVSQLIANDISRAMIVLMPFALEGSIRASLQLSSRARRLLIPLGLAACAIPTRIVVTDFSAPVQWLPAVLKIHSSLRLDRPAAEWLSAAQRQFQENAAAADFNARIALRLDPKLAHAHNLRGLIAVQNAKWEEASAHFVAACNLEAQNFHLWLNLAFVRWKLRDDTGYAQCIAQARQAGGSDPALAAGIAHLEAMVARAGR